MKMKVNICYFFSFGFFVISVFLFFLSVKFNFMDLSVFMEWELLNLNSSMICFSVLFDFKSLCFMSFVLFISSMIVFYSNLYMHGDFNVDRFIILVVLFVLSMMFLIISPNLMSILLGWDGLGLVSYCLVIYYQNVKSYNAGMLTVMSNRVGDVCLLISIAWMLNFGTWNFVFYYEMTYMVELKMILFLVILAAMTKSAQIPFSSWLPAAMAAPTPVSALVHSSTLVTAGVYLLIRFNNLIYNLNLNGVLLFIGCLTMFMAGLGANFEFDLKKIIALSTLSQLGFMICSIGLNLVDLSYFHLLTHALFKALLFMCAGVFIHSLNNLQDIRGMGSLIHQMPFVSVCFNFSNLALCGMPFLAGFYSKDLILELSLMTYMNMFIFFMYFVSVGLTVCYTFRLMYYTMSMDFNYMSYHNLNDESWEFIMPMMVMCLFSIMGGSMLSWIILKIPEVVMLSNNLKFIVLLIMVIGGWLGFELSNLKMFIETLYLDKKMVKFLGEMWFMPYLSTSLINYYPLKFGMKVYKCTDVGWLEELGGRGMQKYFYGLSSDNQRVQSKNLKTYLISFFFWVMIMFYFIIYFL